MHRSELPRVLAAAAFGCALTFMATSAPAQDDPNDPNSPDVVDLDCIHACHEAQRDCMFDGRQAFKLCLEEAGCDTLGDDYRATCLVADRDEDACTDARDAFRACVEPCHEDAHALGDACREARNACLTDECGLDELPGSRHPERPAPQGPKGSRGPRGGRPQGRR